MTVLKNLFIDLATDPLTDWQKRGNGDQTNTTLEPDCSFALPQELGTDKCWLLEAVLSVSAAPLDPDGARLWATFRKHDPGSSSTDTYSVQVRLEDDAGTKQLVLCDMAATPSPTTVSTLVLDRGWDWTDDAPRIRVRLRLDVDAAGAHRTLHLEAEPAGDPRYDKDEAALRVSKDLNDPDAEVQTQTTSPPEVGFGNFGAQPSHWESVHLTVADKGTALPYWPAPLAPLPDPDQQVDQAPSFRLFSPGLGEVTLEFDCQDNPGDKYLDSDRLTLTLEVNEGTAPPDRTYSSVPAGLDSHTFGSIDDEQEVTGKAVVCDVSGRCTQSEVSVVVDNSGPALRITDLRPEYAMAGTPVTVEFSSSEPLDDATIHVTVGGRDMVRDGESTSPYCYTYTPDGAETAGPQTVLVHASDPAGNTSQVTDVGGVTFDFIVPTIDAAGAWVDRAFVADEGAFNLFVEVTDVGSAVNPAEVRMTLDKRPLTLVDQTGSTFQFDYQVDADMDSPGPHSVEVYAEDLAGNKVVETLVDIVTFKFAPPGIELTQGPAEPVGDGRPFAVTLTVAEEPGSVDDATFSVTVGGQPMVDGAFDDPTFEFRHEASSGVSGEGPQDIDVTFKDAAGNATTRTFPGAVTFDFSPPAVKLDNAPAAPVGDTALVHVTLEITDVYSDIDTGDTFVVTLGGRPMVPGGAAHPSYPYSLTTNSDLDTDGPKDLVVTVRDKAGNETVETFPAAVSYDFTGPVIAVDHSPGAPVAAGAAVDIVLNVTDDYSDIDIGPTFYASLGGREMTRTAFDHPTYGFTLVVDDTKDEAGPQDLVVTVRDAAGNRTEQTFPGLATYQVTAPLSLVNSRITLLCAQGDDGRYHQQYDPELEVTPLPGRSTPYVWHLDDIVAWNDIVPGRITVEIEPYADAVWQALPQGDPRREAIRLAAVVPVTIDVPEGIWLEESDLTARGNPWFRFTGTLDDEPFSVTVALRTLSADAFLVFEKQDRAGPVRISQPSEPDAAYTWSVEKLAGLDAGFTVGFEHDAGDDDHLGARIVVHHTAGDWPALGASGEPLDPDDLAEGTFDLKLSQPGFADSYLPCSVRLRKLIGDRHLAMLGQVYQDDHPDVLWKESAVIAAPGETFSGCAVDAAGADLANPPLVLNELLGLAATPASAPPSAAGDTPWHQDQTFNLRIQAAEATVVPSSFFDGRGLHFRELSPGTLRLSDKLTEDCRELVPGPHRAQITVAGNSERWVFGDLDAFDLDSDLDADRSTLHAPTTKVDITWSGGDLQPRESGELALVLLRADDPEVPLSPPVRVSLPVEVTRSAGVAVLRWGAPTPMPSHRLPDAYQRLPYKGELEALVYDLRDGDRIDWALEGGALVAARGDGSPLALSRPGEQEHRSGDAPGQAQRNTLQTPDVPEAAGFPGAVPARPDPYTIGVRVTHLRPAGGGVFREIAGGTRHDLALHVHESPAAGDVALLLDRSGSMSGRYWNAARAGADLFASLTRETGLDSQVGLHWFWGDTDASADKPQAGVCDLGRAQAPDHLTALGAGLLYGRDELTRQSETGDDVGPQRRRTILLLTDGLENRAPRLDQVFVAAPDEHWNRFGARHENTPTTHPQGPGVRIRSLAMGASDSDATSLRDVAAVTGGCWAQDVQTLRPHPTATALAHTQRWCVRTFADLYGFHDSPRPRDTTLKSGGAATHKIAVNLAMDTLVFYQLGDAPDPKRWDLTVRLPDTDLELTPALAAAHDGITFHRGPTYQMYVVRFPLAIAGHEHRWVGDWTLRVTRGAGTAGVGHCFVGALCRQALQCHTDLLTSPRPRPGEEATLRVLLRDRRGNPIRQARVTTKVHTPGPWAGETVARRVATDRNLVKKLRKSSSKAYRDVEPVADRVLRYLIEHDEMLPGRSFGRNLVEVSPGRYETRITLAEAGEYQLETTVEGDQPFCAQELSDWLEPHQRRLRKTLPMAALTRELRYLRERCTTRQAFRQTVARAVGVLFEPSPSRTAWTVEVVDDRILRLEVTPADSKGRLLGPGWAERLSLFGPTTAPRRWPAEDRGDGRYRVDIPFKAKKPHLDRRAGAVVASRLELIHPDGPIHVSDARLRPSDFAAELLDVRLTDGPSR